MRKPTDMTIRLKTALALTLLSGLLFFSCKQEPIFFDLSKEPEPKDPLIEGSPTNIVVSMAGGADFSVYAASIESSTIHRYREGGWYSFSVPGAIGQLAATDSHLYAIFRNSNTLYQVSGGAGPIGLNAIPQSVYGAGNRVFVGMGPGRGPYSVVCYDESGSPPPDLSSVSGLLTGAAKAGADYFIATTSGIYKIDSSNAVTDLVTGQHFMGIICVDSHIMAITSNGKLYYFSHTSLPALNTALFLSLSGGPYTGAMSSWYEYGSGGWASDPSLLLLGVIGSSSARGYREVILDTTNGEPSGDAVIPGISSPSSVEKSVENKARYEAAIGKHAVFSILQVPSSVESPPPGGKPVIFASTTKDGLWSLRDDKWNAEE
jgi:hypothetical protein